MDVGGLTYEQHLVFCCLEGLEVHHFHANLFYCYKVFNRLLFYDVAVLLSLAPLISRKYNFNKLYCQFTKIDALKHPFFFRVVAL